MHNKTLQLKNYSVSVQGKDVIKNITLALDAGSLHVLMGPNGSGKSSLALSLMGHPAYQVTGFVALNDQEITTLPAHKRAQAGLFLSFQQPQEIAGVQVATYLKAIYEAVHGHIEVAALQHKVYAYLELLELDHGFYYRNLNEGFSGGQKKKFEMLQLLLLKPRVAILDEIDSGLDVDALRVVAQALHVARNEHPAMCVLLITHYQRIVHYMQVNAVHLLVDGTIVRSGDAALAQAVEAHGYENMSALQ